ncbi:MAG: DEAD/DEAH box helicase [Phycisphaerae bacterium]|nr:DEAD/DEAH box helicase [Phycisphaerae bacterium]
MEYYKPENPLIVQPDHTILVETASEHYIDARDQLVRFAELIKSPEHIHTYRLTPLSIWNACSAGLNAEQISQCLTDFSKYPVPEHVLFEVKNYASRYGKLIIKAGPDGKLILAADDILLAEEIWHNKHVVLYLEKRLSDTEFLVEPLWRGKLKSTLTRIGFPAEDLAGYTDGDSLELQLREKTLDGENFTLREYQNEAADAFYAQGSARGGSGVIVLPCGAGKTIVGIASMVKQQATTLILTTSTTAVRQWRDELLDKTSLHEDQVGEYTGQRKEIKPVTIATYNIMTWRESKDSPFKHMGLFESNNWGLIVYDEVHLLPAPVFQFTASLQARRRLGLTATLVREDGKEDEVFSLIGPKKADVPWKILEHQGWIAKATCTEYRIPLQEEFRMTYAIADKRRKFRIASENISKLAIVKNIVQQHPNDQILIISMYLDQLKKIATFMDVPILTGQTPQRKRDELFEDFKSGKLQVLAVSKVANFAVDLPDASVAIQVSGTFGSRQEEAQRLGRILRPKAKDNQAYFYSLVTADTVEQEFAMKRQLFLCEQGYCYNIKDIEIEE